MLSNLIKAITALLQGSLSKEVMLNQFQDIYKLAQAIVRNPDQFAAEVSAYNKTSEDFKLESEYNETKRAQEILDFLFSLKPVEVNKFNETEMDEVMNSVNAVIQSVGSILSLKINGVAFKQFNKLWDAVKTRLHFLTNTTNKIIASDKNNPLTELASLRDSLTSQSNLNWRRQYNQWEAMAKQAKIDQSGTSDLSYVLKYKTLCLEKLDATTFAQNLSSCNIELDTFIRSGIYHPEYAKSLMNLYKNKDLITHVLQSDAGVRMAYIEIFEKLIKLCTEQLTEDAACPTWILNTLNKLMVASVSHSARSDTGFYLKLKDMFMNLSWMLSLGDMTQDGLKKEIADFTDTLIIFMNINHAQIRGLEAQLKNFITFLPKPLQEKIFSKLNREAKKSLGINDIKNFDVSSTSVHATLNGNGHFMEKNFFESIRKTFCPHFESSEKQASDKEVAATEFYVDPLHKSANYCGREVSLGGLKYDTVLSVQDETRAIHRFFFEFNGVVFHYLYDCQNDKLVLNAKSKAKSKIVAGVNAHQFKKSICVQISQLDWERFQNRVAEDDIVKRQEFVKFLQNNISSGDKKIDAEFGQVLENLANKHIEVLREERRLKEQAKLRAMEDRRRQEQLRRELEQQEAAKQRQSEQEHTREIAKQEQAKLEAIRQAALQQTLHRQSGSPEDPIPFASLSASSASAHEKDKDLQSMDLSEDPIDASLVHAGSLGFASTSSSSGDPVVFKKRGHWKRKNAAQEERSSSSSSLSSNSPSSSESDSGDAMDLRDGDSRDDRDSRDRRDSRDSDYRSSRDHRDSRVSRDYRDHRDSRDSRDSRNSRDYRDERYDRDDRDQRSGKKRDRNDYEQQQTHSHLGKKPDGQPANKRPRQEPNASAAFQATAQQQQHQQQQYPQYQQTGQGSPMLNFSFGVSGTPGASEFQGFSGSLSLRRESDHLSKGFEPVVMNSAGGQNVGIGLQGGFTPGMSMSSSYPLQQVINIHNTFIFRAS